MLLELFKDTRTTYGGRGVIYTVCLSQLANCRSQFLLDHLGRCLKLFVSSERTFCHKFVSQFGPAIFLYAKNIQNYREYRVAYATVYLNEAPTGHSWPGEMRALDISTGPLARRTFQTAGPVWASTFYLSLARTGHLDICRATRFHIALARTMMNHSIILFARAPVPHLGSCRAVLLLQRDASLARVRVRHVNQHTDVSV